DRRGPDPVVTESAALLHGAARSELERPALVGHVLLAERRVVAENSEEAARWVGAVRPAHAEGVDRVTAPGDPHRARTDSDNDHDVAVVPDHVVDVSLPRG